MNPDEKSQKRATDVIAAYGAEQSAWPDAERAATRDALQSSDELRQILSEEASLDSLLQQSARGGDTRRYPSCTTDCPWFTAAADAVLSG